MSTYIKDLMEEIQAAANRKEEIKDIHTRLMTDPELLSALKFLKREGMITERPGKYIAENSENIYPTGLTKKGERYLRAI